MVAYSAEFVTDSASLAMAAARSGLIREGGRGQVGLHLTRSESPLERPGLSGRRS